MRLLVLGGTEEGRAIASALTEAGHAVTYSLAGITPPPILPCPIRTGGFGGAAGLAGHLQREGIEGVIDATHPYAARISAHAAAACERLSLPLWRWTRPPCTPTPEDRWIRYPDADGLLQALAPYRRILFTVGALAYRWLPERRPGQTWLVRALNHPEPLPEGVHPLPAARGRLEIAGERAVLAKHRPEVVVSKDSGGTATVAKLQAARERRLPVLILARPPAPAYGTPVRSLRQLLAGLGPPGRGARPA